MPHNESKDQRPEKNPRLVIDKAVFVPPPFESDFASVSLAIASNDPTEGYPLTVRAYFQPQYITINAGDTEIRVFCEVLQASVRLQFVGCVGEAVFDLSDRQPEDIKTSEVWENSVEAELVLNKNAGLGGGISLTAGDLVDINARVEANKSNKVTRKEVFKKVRSTERRQVRVVSKNHLHLGHYSDGVPLDGIVADDFKWLKVTPVTATQRSGVLAKLTVRETWMRFKDVTPRSSVAMLGKLLAKLGNSERHEDRFRKVAFEALLRHLVKVELQSPSEKDEATLSIHAVALMPESAVYCEDLSPFLPRRRISVDAAPLEKLLLSDIGDAIKLLKDEGVDPESVDDVVSIAKANDGLQSGGTREKGLNSVLELVGSQTLSDIVLETTSVIEKMCIETAVELTRSNLSAAAEMLGINRSTLYSKIRKHGIVVNRKSMPDI